MITPNGNRHVIVRGSIAGIVSVVPSNTVTNDELGDGAHEAAKITGVFSRRMIRRGNGSLLSMAKTACMQLMSRIEWSADSIDLLVYVSQTPGMDVPADVFALKHSLNLKKDCIVLQTNWSCAGYVYGLWQSMSLLHAIGLRAILVAGDDSSSIMDPRDRATYPLFGDAITATAIGSVGPRQHFILGSSPAGFEGLVKRPGEYLRMDGASVFQFTLREVPNLVSDVLNVQTWAPEFILFHQANAFMLDHLVKKCKLDANKTPRNLDRFGNTSSASIPLLMCTELGRAGVVDKMLPVAMLGFGAGWAWAGARVECTGMRVCDLVEV